VADRRFWPLAAGMFFATLPGLMVISKIKAIGVSFGVGAAAAGGVAVLAAGNALGRIVWGLLYDRLGPRRSVVLSTSFVALSMVGLALAGHSAPAFLAAVALVGFVYGGCFGIYAPQVAEIYGSALMGTVYAVVMSFHGIAAMVGPPLCGMIADETDRYTPALWAAAGVAAVGLLVYVLLTLRPGSLADHHAHHPPEADEQGTAP
jgi:OFA family oxalate/formate antiporter-like MFS transporter